MAATPPFSRTHSSFNLLRRFALASLLMIALIAVVNGTLLSNFLTKRLLEREANVSMDFVLNVLKADGSIGYLVDPANSELAARFDGSILHFTSMPDVQRVNVYARDHTVLWSTARELIGQKFDQNEELSRALQGSLVFDGGSIADNERTKPEHIGLNAASTFFVETYIPIRLTAQGDVVGVFELYKAPVGLTAAINDGNRQIWLSAAVGALALFVTLFWIVRSADRKIQDQHQRLLQAETMVVVGELASSVAHNIRNPLASIRSSAEVALELHSAPSDEQARDIMDSVDRIEGWLRDMVSFGHVDQVRQTRVEVVQLLQNCFGNSVRDFDQCGIEGVVLAGAPAAMVNADRALLGHVLHGIVANAIEATPQGGRVTGHIAARGGMVHIRIADTGCGMAQEQLDKVFSLFFTTKPRGLGIGLTLARRAVERFGGTIRADSTLGAGTVFTIDLPEA